MLIQVQYPDGRNDYVKEFILDTLIESKKITRFRRVSGWVTLGVDTLRTAKRSYTYKTPNELRRLKV